MNKKQEIVINRCYGGFGLSHKGIMEYAKITGIKLYPKIDDIQKNEKVNFDNAMVVHYYTSQKMEDKSYFRTWDIKRDDEALIKVVKKMGKKANGRCADLKIVKIPADVKWEIEEYDGSESISEEHRTWN